MRKLNLEQLENELEVISTDQLWCIKGGYGDYGMTPMGSYGSSYDPLANYDNGGGLYSFQTGSGSGQYNNWSAVISAAQNGALPTGLYTNMGNNTFDYTPNGSAADSSYVVNIPSASTNNSSGYDPTVPGFCYFDALAYLSDQFGTCHDQSYFETKLQQQYGANHVINVDAQTAVGFLLKNSDFYSFNLAGQGQFAFEVALAAGSKILTDIRLNPTDPNTTHAVVIYGFNSTTMKYNYHDATTNTNSEARGDEFGVTMAVAVNGH